MKYIQNICLSSLLIVSGILQVSANSNVTIIDVIDTKTISFAVSEGIQLPEGILKWDIKILQDIDVSSAAASSSDPKSVLVKLESPLQALTEYSILTVFGMEWSIDFKTGVQTASGTVFMNTALTQGEQWISSLILKDSSTLEIQYTSELLADEFEYKILATVPVKQIEKKKNDTRIYVTLSSEIYPSEDYILMTLALQDINNAPIEFDGGIYDFSSPATLESFSPVDTSSETASGSLETPLISIIGEDVDTSMAQETIQQKIAKRNAEKNISDSPSVAVSETTNEMLNTTVEPELNAAPEETHFVKDIALSAQSTPETGAETWIILFLSLIINTFFYFTRTKQA